MAGTSANKLMVRELVAKALAIEVIDDEFADELRKCESFDEALEMFQRYIIDQGGDPESLLRRWDIIE